MLNISSARLPRLPDEIGELLNLKILLVSNNFLTSAPSIRSLMSLRWLDFSNNRLNGVPTMIGNFPQLRWLNLFDNRLTHLTHDFRFLTQLETLLLKQNEFDFASPNPEHVDSFCITQRLLDSDTPQEIVATANEWSTGQARLNRFKLALVGDGAAGKTTLRARLVNNELEARSASDEQPRTTWIQQDEWHPVGVEDWSFDIWDFPGQPEHYATHNLFLSDWQCVFVIVSNMADDHWKSRLEYWVSFLQCKSSSVIDRYRPQHFVDNYLLRSNHRKLFGTIVIGSHIDEVKQNQDFQRRQLSVKVVDLQQGQAVRHIEFQHGGAFDLSRDDIHPVVELVVEHGKLMFSSVRNIIPSSHKQVFDWIQRARKASRLGTSGWNSVPLSTLGDMVNTITDDKGELIGKSRMLPILKQLHSIGEVVFMPALATSLESDSDDIIDDGELVVLSFNWLLARIGELVDVPDPKRDAGSISEAIKQRRSIIAEHRGRLASTVLAPIWHLKPSDAVKLATVLEKMLLCFRVDSNQQDPLFVFPLLLPKLDKDERLAKLTAGDRPREISFCRWIRSGGDRALPPGAFGLLQSKLHRLIRDPDQSSRVKGRFKACVQDLPYCHETYIRVGHLLVLVSNHNPSLGVRNDSFDAGIAQNPTGHLDSMLSICLFQPKGIEATSNVNDVWKWVLEIVHQACRECGLGSQFSPAREKLKLKEEIPCIECVRAKLLNHLEGGPRFSVCRLLTEYECIYAPDDSYICEAAGSEVLYRSLVLENTAAPRAVPQDNQHVGELAVAPALPREPQPASQTPRPALTTLSSVLAPRQNRVQRSHRPPVAHGPNEIESLLRSVASELEIQPTLRDSINRLLESHLIRMEQYFCLYLQDMPDLMPSRTVEGFRARLSHQLLHQSHAMTTVLVEISGADQHMTNRQRSELFSLLQLASEAACASSTGFAISPRRTQPTVTDRVPMMIIYDVSNVCSALKKRHFPVELVPVLAVESRLLQFSVHGKAIPCRYREVQLRLLEENRRVGGLAQVVMACRLLFESERDAHCSLSSSAVVDVMALSHVASMRQEKPQTVTFESLFRGCFGQLKQVVESNNNRELAEILFANELEAPNNLALIQWLDELSNASSKVILDRLNQSSYCNEPHSGLTPRDIALWSRCNELQHPMQVFASLLAGHLPALAADIQSRLPVLLNDIPVAWECEIVATGSVGSGTFVPTIDHESELFVWLKPHLVDVDLDGAQVWFTNRAGERQLQIDSIFLGTIWQAFVASVKEFTEQHHSILEIPEIRPREWAKFEDDPTKQMWASFSFGDTEVDVLPAVKQGDEFLVLLRSCKPDGSNIVKSFSNLGARRIASLPDKAKHLICALKHVVKVVHDLDVPGSMFESVVLEVFEQQGWIGDLDEVQLASISFIDAWRLCWDRILSWRPISAPNKSLEEDVDLLSLIDKTELTRVGEALSSIDEKSLLDECLNGTRESLARLIASRSLSSTSPSPSGGPLSSLIDFPSSMPRQSRSWASLLARTVALHLDTVRLDVQLRWRAEYREEYCTPFIVVTPSYLEHMEVNVHLEDDCVSLIVGPHEIELGSDRLASIWAACKAGFGEFASQYKDMISLATFDDGHLVSYDPREMRCSMLVAGSRVDIKLALPSNAGVRLVLLQEPTPDGSNVVKYYTSLAEKRANELSDGWRTVLSQITDIVQRDNISIPSTFLLGIVLSAFERHTNREIDQALPEALIAFAWQQCWGLILDGQPISAPEREDTNLFDTIQDRVKQQLQDLARRMLAQKEPSVAPTGMYGSQLGRSLSR